MNSLDFPMRIATDQSVGAARFINLVRALFAREVKGRYRRSFLGLFWTVLPPTFYTAIFVFIQGVLKISSEYLPYVLFAYSAMVLWSFVSSAIGRCGSSLTANAGIIKKIAVAREVFLVTAVLTALTDAAVAFVLLVAMLAWFHIPFGISMLWVPVIVALAVVLAIGVGMLVAALGAVTQDALFAVPLLMQLWMLLSPVMYPLSQVPDAWRDVYRLNPMVGIVEGFRAVMVKGVGPDLGLLAVAVVGTALIVSVAWPFFRYASQNIADVL